MMEFENGKNPVPDQKKICYISDAEALFRINNFVKVRENYFTCLRKAICENCKMYSDSLSDKTLDEMSLSFEQPVLLACLKRKIYQKLMRDIIFEIRKLSREGTLHLKIKMMLENRSGKIYPSSPSESKRNDDRHFDDTSGSTNSPPDGIRRSLNVQVRSPAPRSSASERSLSDSESYEDCGDDDDYYVRADIIDILENDDRPTSTNSFLNEKPPRKRSEDHDDDRKKFQRLTAKQTAWKHEKIIQMHNMSLLLSRRSEEERLKNEIVFLDLFGADSDPDEDVLRDDEIYRRICSERISALVVEQLMPYYRENRIVGRTVFKKLGHFISGKIAEVTRYPDRRYVKYFVTKFFRGNKIYKSESDVLNIKLSWLLQR